MCGASRTSPIATVSGTAVTSEKIGSVGKYAGAAGGGAGGGVPGCCSARSATARATMSAASISLLRLPSRSCAIQPPNAALARSMSSSSSALTGHFCCIQRFITCSTSQATSPRSMRPTMRPLPLSVWKPRRISARTSRFSGRARLCDSPVSMLPSTSPASSRKTPSSSASTAGRAGGALAGGAGVAAAGGGAAGAAPAAACTTVESALRSAIGACALS